jgi:hypothetical protein
MSRIISSLALFTFVVSLSGLADAKSCHGANGKFVKCPKTTATQPMQTKDSKGHCHGSNGKFVKCAK